MLDATWDKETDCWYFSNGRQAPVVKTIILERSRTVTIDVDPYGQIIGVEVV